MATLATFRNSVASKLGLNNTAGSSEQALIDQWLNEGVVEVLLGLQCYVNSATSTLTVGQGDYTLDSSILLIKDLTVIDSSGQVWPIMRLSPEEILYMRRTSPAGSSPIRFYAVNGANVLMVYPTPTAADTLTQYYVPRPTALANVSDDPSAASLGGIPSEYHKLIEWWALSEGADYDDDSSSQAGLVYRQKFEQKMRDYRKRMHQKGGRHLPRKLPAAAIRQTIPPRNDIDIPRFGF